MGFKIQLSATEGTQLLRAAYNNEFPEKVGDKTFSGNIRATLLKQRRQLYKTLKKASPILIDEDKTYFGPRSFWAIVERSDKDLEQIPKEVRDIERRVYRMIDRTNVVEIELTGQAKDGLYWLLFLWAHPDSKTCFPAGMQEDIVWPLAERLGRVKALEEAIGLTKNETIAIKDDDEYETEKVDKSDKPDPDGKSLENDTDTKVIEKLLA